MKGNNLFWKIYAVCWTLLCWTHARPNSPAAWVSVVISALGLVALLGYAFDRRLFHRLLWQIVFWLLVASNVFDHLSGKHNSFFVECVAFLLLLPAYVGVFRYGYSSPQLWSRDDVHAAAS